jgi:hypothetical protein
MYISPNVLKSNYKIVKGKTFRGRLPENQEKEHVIIIICNTGSSIFYVCITSQTDSLAYLTRDDPKAYVKLTDEERDLYWKNGISSYVFTSKPHNKLLFHFLSHVF